jgi:hypothetical protein
MSKCEFGKTSMIYLGYIVGNGQLKIDPAKVEVNVKWPKSTIGIEVRRFLGSVQYLRKFISNFSFIASPLHALTNVKRIFQWGCQQQKSFKTLKEKISIAPVLALPDLQHPFEIQIDANGYAMGEFLMQRGKPICYHFETFTQAVINYQHMIRNSMLWYKV